MRGVMSSTIIAVSKKEMVRGPNQDETEMEKIMYQKNYVNPVIALAVAIPSLVIPTVALATDGTNKVKSNEIVIAQAEVKKKAKVRKKVGKTRKTTSANAKKQLRAELKRLTPAQRSEIGEARIGKLNSLSGNVVVARGCFTNGVGCAGIPAFSNGVVCCAIIRAGI